MQSTLWRSRCSASSPTRRDRDLQARSRLASIRWPKLQHLPSLVDSGDTREPPEVRIDVPVVSGRPSQKWSGAPSLRSRPFVNHALHGIGGTRFLGLNTLAQIGEVRGL